MILVPFAVWYARRLKIAPLDLMDRVVFCVPACILLTRMANFWSGHILGVPTAVPWAVAFDDGIPRHPTQIYEGLIGVGVFFVLACVYDAARKRDRFPVPGMMTATFFAVYFPCRIAVEFLKEHQAIGGPFTMGQIISVPPAIVGLIWITAIRSRNDGSQETTETAVSPGWAASADK